MLFVGSHNSTVQLRTSGPPINAKVTAVAINSSASSCLKDNTPSLTASLDQIQGAEHVDWGDSMILSSVLDSGGQDVHTKPGSFHEDTTGTICPGVSGHHFNYRTGGLSTPKARGMTHSTTVTNLSHSSSAQVPAPMPPKWNGQLSNSCRNSWVTYHKRVVGATVANIIDLAFAGVIFADLRDLNSTIAKSPSVEVCGEMVCGGVPNHLYYVLFPVKEWWMKESSIYQIDLNAGEPIYKFRDNARGLPSVFLDQIPFCDRPLSMSSWVLDSLKMFGSGCLNHLVGTDPDWTGLHMPEGIELMDLALNYNNLSASNLARVVARGPGPIGGPAFDCLVKARNTAWIVAYTQIEEEGLDGQDALDV